MLLSCKLSLCYIFSWVVPFKGNIMNIWANLINWEEPGWETLLLLPVRIHCGRGSGKDCWFIIWFFTKQKGTL